MARQWEPLNKAAVRRDEGYGVCRVLGAGARVQFSGDEGPAAVAWAGRGQGVGCRVALSRAGLARLGRPGFGVSGKKAASRWGLRNRAAGAPTVACTAPAQAELARLHALEEEIMSTTGPEDERLEAIYDRIDELDPTTFESRAAELLHGLGFSPAYQQRMTKDLSGGAGGRGAAARETGEQRVGWGGGVAGEVEVGEVCVKGRSSRKWSGAGARGETQWSCGCLPAMRGQGPVGQGLQLRREGVWEDVERVELCARGVCTGGGTGVLNRVLPLLRSLAVRRLAYARGAGPRAVRRPHAAAAGRAHQPPGPGGVRVAGGVPQELQQVPDRHLALAGGRDSMLGQGRRGRREAWEDTGGGQGSRSKHGNGTAGSALLGTASTMRTCRCGRGDKRGKEAPCGRGVRAGGAGARAWEGGARKSMDSGKETKGRVWGAGRRPIGAKCWRE